MTLGPSSETMELNTPFFLGSVSLGDFGHGDVEVTHAYNVRQLPPKMVVALQRTGRWATNNRGKVDTCVLREKTAEANA